MLKVMVVRGAEFLVAVAVAAFAYASADGGCGVNDGGGDEVNKILNGLWEVHDGGEVKERNNFGYRGYVLFRTVIGSGILV